MSHTADVPGNAPMIDTADGLARVLRRLRRRLARQSAEPELTYRQIAAVTGWSHAAIGFYFTGKIVPPTDRLDILIRLLGATPAEFGALATARDRAEDQRRHAVIERPVPGTTVASPRELPRDVHGFTGRTAELDRLDGLCRTGMGTTVPVVALVGTAGVGKTALAVHWAHRVARRFPDGQLHLDLCGHGIQPPVSVATALAAFLGSMGVRPSDIPDDAAERSRRYRTMMAGRRMLVLLDNVHAADQVRPLLPGTGGSLVLVTGRDDLAGLVARDGAHRVALDVMSEGDAVALMHTLIGAPVDADPAGAAALAEACAYLPLALRVAAELAADRPGVSMAALLAELRSECPLSALVAGGDPNTAVRAVLSWSHRHLSPAAAQAFAFLGRHLDQVFDAHVLLPLTAGDLPRAARLVDELARAHLLRPMGLGRYAMHDLLRAYAAELADARSRRR